MKLHQFWSKCKLRLNIVANKNVVSEEYLNVYHLMNQFRLPYESPNLISVTNITKIIFRKWSITTINECTKTNV